MFRYKCICTIEQKNNEHFSKHACSDSNASVQLKVPKQLNKNNEHFSKHACSDPNASVQLKVPKQLNKKIINILANMPVQIQMHLYN